MRYTRRGLGITLTPDMIRMGLEQPMSRLLSTLPGGGGAAPLDMTPECVCKAEQLLSSLGAAGDAMLLNQLAAACTAEPAAMDQAAQAAGVSLEACKPWYLRKTTWIVGGLLGAGVVAVAVLR